MKENLRKAAAQVTVELRAAVWQGLDSAVLRWRAGTVAVELLLPLSLDQTDG